MIIESTDPSTSRSRFITRTYVNMAVITAMFILGVIVLSFLSSVLFPGSSMTMLIFDGIALACAYYFYILWEKRPIRLVCRNCNKIILSNTPWFCAACNRPNTNTTEFPFVHKCEHCGAEPKAYRCHNPECKEIIYLSEDEDKTNYAHRLNSPDENSEQDKRTQQLKTKLQMKEDREHEILMAQSDVTLIELKQRHKFIKGLIKSSKKKPPIESKRENLKEFFGTSIAAEQAAREQKAANAIECKGDAAERRRRDRVVDSWLEREKAGDNE